MRLSVLLLLALVLAGCGRSHVDRTATQDPGQDDCMLATLGPRPSVNADLDGDGTPETVQDLAGKNTGDCPPSVLRAEVDGKNVTAPVTADLVVALLRKVTLPGRTGDLVLVIQTHPRGGLQARLYGYADHELAELTANGDPIFGFLATDAPADHLSATCTQGGFTVSEAVTHQPIGIIAAWDLFATTYAVKGNDVTKGERRQIAENVLDKDLATKYPGLVGDALFKGC